MPDDPQQPQPVLEYAQPEKQDRDGLRLLQVGGVLLLGGVGLTAFAILTAHVLATLAALAAFIFGATFVFIGGVAEFIRWLRTR